MEKSQECFVLFIDIMGFADFVDTNEAEYVRKYLSDLISMVNEINETNERFFGYNVSIFSDSIVLSIPKENNIIELHKFLMYVNNLQLMNIVKLELGELPLRGAITEGEFFTDNKNLIFGKALVTAHKIESKFACYPRIIVNSDELHPEKARKAAERINFFFKTSKSEPIEFNEYSHSVRLDSDGLLHCNYLSVLRESSGSKWRGYFQDYIEKHKNFIIKKLKEASSNRVAEKYYWMTEYHNWFCSGFEELQHYKI